MFLVSLSGCSCSTFNKISAEDLKQYVQQVEITPENWEEYFELEDYRSASIDSFGQETGGVYEGKRIKHKDGVIPSSDLVMEFAYTENMTEKMVSNEGAIQGTSESKEDITRQIEGLNTGTYEPVAGNAPPGSVYSTYNKRKWGSSYWMEDTYEISDFRLNRSKGNIYKCNIPDDLWQNSEENGRYIAVKTKSKVLYLYENGKSAYSSSSYDYTTFGNTYIWPIEEILKSN